MSCSICTIPLDQFFNKLVLNSPVFDAKAQLFKSTYKCFSAPLQPDPPANNRNTGSGWRSRNKPIHAAGSSADAAHRGASVRPKIGIVGALLTPDVKVHREFVALMNKMTHSNKLAVTKTFSASYDANYIEVYVPVVWDMMLRATEYQTLYVDILLIIENADIGSIWKEYIGGKRWLPPADMQVLGPDNTDYDEFCDFVKWKKRAIASVHALLLLSSIKMLENDVIRELTPLLLCDCRQAIDENTASANVLIEQIFVLCDKVHGDTQTERDAKALIRDFATTFKARGPDLQPSTRFKIYDLYEKIDPKPVLFKRSLRRT